MIRKATSLTMSILLTVLLLPGRFESTQPSRIPIDIPAGATITSADLSLYVITARPTATVNVHRIIKSWTETGLTYNDTLNDFIDSVPSASFIPGAVGWSTVSIKALVQGWVNGTYPNYGIALVQGEIDNSRYNSSEYGTVTQRPKLRICYTAPGVSETCDTIQRPGSVQDGVADSFVCSCGPTTNYGSSTYLDTGVYSTIYHRQAQIRFNIPVTHPSINIVKSTNDAIASDPNGSDVPSIKPGDPVVWKYRITNTGDVAFTVQQVSVTDDQPGVVPVFDSIISGSSPTLFNPGDIWLYKASGLAVNLAAPPDGTKTTGNACTHAGTQLARTAYINTGTVSVPGAVTKTAHSSYCNPANPAVSMTKYTNGAAASDPNGADVPLIKPDDPVAWTYQVTNNGNISVSRSNVSVTDDQPGVVPVFEKEISGNGNTTFDPGEVWQYKATGKAVNLSSPPAGVKIVQGVCTKNGTQAARTAYVNQGTVSIPGFTPQTARSSYCNPPVSGVGTVKYTNGATASDPNGADVPRIKPGDPVTWLYKVTNTGQTILARSDIMVTDDMLPGDQQPVFDRVLTGNSDQVFSPGDIWQFKKSGIAIDLSSPGNVKVTPNVCNNNATETPRNGYVNLATVTIPGATASASSSYCNPLVTPSVSIIKYTNGIVASDPNGADVPEIKPGEQVTWTYRITYNGTVAVPRVQVQLTDDMGAVPVFDKELSGDADTNFDPGEVWYYKATGTAIDLLHPGSVMVVPGVCRRGVLSNPGRNAYVNLVTVKVLGVVATASSSYCNPNPVLYLPLLFQK